MEMVETKKKKKVGVQQDNFLLRKVACWSSGPASQRYARAFELLRSRPAHGSKSCEMSAALTDLVPQLHLGTGAIALCRVNRK